jgi:hypothetical protein
MTQGPKLLLCTEFDHQITALVLLQTIIETHRSSLVDCVSREMNLGPGICPRR